MSVVAEVPSCPICLSTITKPKRFPACRHEFCGACLDSWLSIKKTCPCCFAAHGITTGDMPTDGRMDVQYLHQISLPGYESYSAIEILYTIPSGYQTREHANPGRAYRGATRRAYLPDSAEGRTVLRLLQQAFDRRLTFTVGTSRTTGRTDVVTWNDIHHKTRTHGGPTSFGYPDPTYLSRVREELAARGIK